MNLQTRMLSAFVIMGLIVLIVGLVGWSSTSRLNKYIDDLVGNAVPSLIGMWKINQGQTSIQSGERLLFTPNITKEKRQGVLTQIAQGWQLINEGIKEYESSPFNDKEEEQQYQKFKQNFNAWKQSHLKFIEIERKFRELGISNPWERRADLLSRGIKDNSPEMNTVKRALALQKKMDEEGVETEEPLYKIVREDTEILLKQNDDLKEEVRKEVEQEVSRSRFWVILGMTIGPLTAIILGRVLSMAIAKPLDQALQGIINMIVSSSTEIGVTVEEQERIASEQATSVNQTTITMEELRASARQAAEQAESATENARQVLNLAEEGTVGARQVLNLAESGATGARQVLNLAEEGTKVVGKTLDGMSELKEKVGAIAHQITRLNDQTNQIGSITSAVTDIANQTNMLALLNLKAVV
ncbi:hypothetical protein BCD67_08570 [Oscillatoriales cyanobacterium USR001]|nr:hypothetical protein BCD67_08570 [Oscillatoriales cyanobacterium USR001]